MPTLKEVLTRQTAIPASIEKSLPAMAPKVSEIMATVANALPINPNLPEIPMAPGGTPTIPTIPQAPAGIANVFKGIESVLPPQAPKFSTGTGSTPVAALSRGGYRPVVTAPPALPTAGAVKAGGYRSI